MTRMTHPAPREQEREVLGWADFDPREFLEGFARGTGQRLGVAFGAAFEVFPMGWGE